MYGKGLLVVLAVTGLSCATRAKSQPPPLSPETTVETPEHLVPNPTLPPRAYTDGLGIVVEIVPLKIEDGGSPQALVRITGIPSFIAGVTFLMTRITEGKEDVWQTPIDGRESRLLHSFHDQDRDLLRLTMPRLNFRLNLRLDPAASAAINTGELVADHQKHVADGSLAKISEFDREYVESGKHDQIEETMAVASTACGTPIHAEMDWSTVKSPDDFTQLHFCAMSLEAITAICGLSLSLKSEIAEKLKVVKCSKQTEQEVLFDQKTGALSIKSRMDAMNTVFGAMTAVASAMKLRPTVLKSPEGLTVVLPVLHEKGDLYAGVGTRLYKQNWMESTPGKAFATWNGGRDAEVKLKEPGLWYAECDTSDVELREVAPRERDQVLANASFEAKLWNRDLFALARDDRGIYYYVDRLDNSAGGLGYRIFKGPRGKLTLTKLVDIVDDARGKIFATSSGDLRLILSNRGPVEARWIRGKRERNLVVINRFEALRFAYGELGVYEGDELGSVCSLAAAAAR